MDAVHPAGGLVEQHHRRSARPREPPRARAADARRPRGRVGSPLRGRRARRSPRPPRPRRPPRARGSGSRPGSGAAAPPRPARSTRPRVGSASPLASRSSVLLPAPLRPISATRSPAREGERDPAQDRGAVLDLVPDLPEGECRRGAAARAAAAERGPPSLGPVDGRAGGSRRSGALQPGGAQPGARLLHGRGQRREAGEGEQARGRGRERRRATRPPTRGTRAGGASHATRPSIIAITRSAAGRQRSSRCSATTTAVPQSSFRRRSSQTSSSPATGSSCEVGSSSTSRGGAWTIAAAIATRWSSPPESVSVRRSSRCATPSA